MASTTDRAHRSPALKSKAANAYLTTLSRFDPVERRALDKRLAGARNTEHVEIVLQHAGQVLKANADDLAKADTRHLDAWLDMTRDSLRQASRRNNEWCAGSRYAGLSDMKGASTAAISQELSGLEDELNGYVFATMSHFLTAIEDARDHPVSRGPVTPRDEAALQGVMMSMISDPQVLPIIMAAQSNDDPEQVLKSINVCDLAATAVTAVKTLPQDTKGRVFAEAVRKARFDKGDLNTIGGFPGF